MKRSSRELFILGGVFIAAFVPWALRFWSDPDLSLTWSRGVFLTDELYHGGNALKAALSGRWLLSDFNYIFMDPLMPLLQRAAYMVGGVSLLAARLPAVILNMAMAFLVALMVYERSPRHKVLSSSIAVFLISTNYYFFIYGRLALIDLPMAALGLISFYFYLQALAGSRALYLRRFALSGIFLYLSLLMKASAVNFILAYLIFTLLTAALRRIDRKTVLRTGIIVLTAALAHYATLRLIRLVLAAEQFSLRSDTLIRYKMPHGVGHLLRLYLTSLGNGFVLHNWALLILALFVLGAILLQIRRGRKPLNTDLLFVSLFVSTFVFHGFFNYHPARYYIILLIPVVWFVATIPWRIEDRKLSRTKEKLILTVALALIVAANSWNLYRYAGHLAQPQYTFVATAKAVGRAIQQDVDSRSFQQCILYDADVHTSIPFYLALDFEYGRNFATALQEGKNVFLISSRAEKEYPVLGVYEMYHHFKFYLYKVKKP